MKEECTTEVSMWACHTSVWNSSVDSVFRNSFCLLKEQSPRTEMLKCPGDKIDYPGLWFRQKRRHTLFNFKHTLTAYWNQLTLGTYFKIVFVNSNSFLNQGPSFYLAPVNDQLRILYNSILLLHFFKVSLICFHTTADKVLDRKKFGTHFITSSSFELKSFCFNIFIYVSFRAIKSITIPLSSNYIVISFSFRALVLYLSLDLVKSLSICFLLPSLSPLPVLSLYCIPY